MGAGEFQRFVLAQDDVLSEVEAELTEGRKRTHWMWFVFPQIAGLGHSRMARLYAMGDVDQARRYLADPIVGERLRRHVRLMLRHDDRTAHGILGSPDDLKFRSCLTLFSAAASNPAHASLFQRGLQTFYGGEPDPATLRLLQTK
jgi:uncharacterized protein (DUF1810 family)